MFTIQELNINNAPKRINNEACEYDEITTEVW